MLDMRSLCRQLKGIVGTMILVLSLTVRTVLLISAMCSLVEEVFTVAFSISPYIVLLNYMYMNTVFTIMILLEYTIITHIEDLINCLAVRLVMFLNITLFIPRDMVIKNYFAVSKHHICHKSYKPV